MKFNQTVKYNLKRVLPILGIAGATLLPACRGHQNEPEPKTGVDTPKVEIQKHDTTLYFAFRQYSTVKPAAVSELLTNPEIANIYMEPTEPTFYSAGKNLIKAVRTKMLEPSINLDSTRVFGRGNLITYPGDIYPEDSLWFVSNGWTVNQQNQR